MQIKWNDEGPDEKFVGEAFEEAQEALLVRGLIAVFDGPDSINAYVSPEQLILPGQFGGGSVFIGRQLIRREQKRWGDDWKKSVAMIVAHEAAHLLQFERGLKIPPRAMELHADYLAGWARREIVSKDPNRPDEGNFDWKALHYPSGTFRDSAVHGSVLQRIEAISTGSAQLGVYSAPFDRGLEFVFTGLTS